MGLPRSAVPPFESKGSSLSINLLMLGSSVIPAHTEGSKWLLVLFWQE